MDGGGGRGDEGVGREGGREGWRKEGGSIVFFSRYIGSDHYQDAEERYRQIQQR